MNATNIRQMALQFRVEQFGSFVYSVNDKEDVNFKVCHGEN